MNNLFECKIKYEILNEKKGDLVSRRKTFIVCAESQSDVEQRVAEEMFLEENIQITSVKELKNTELIFDREPILHSELTKRTIVLLRTTESEFAKEIGISDDTLSDILRGRTKVTPEMVEKSRILVRRFWEKLDLEKKLKNIKLLFDKENETQMTDSEKLKNLIQLMQMTQMEFAKETGISALALSHVLSGRNNLTSEMIENILVAIRQFNENLK